MSQIEPNCNKRNLFGTVPPSECLNDPVLPVTAVAMTDLIFPASQAAGLHSSLQAGKHSQ